MKYSERIIHIEQETCIKCGKCVQVCPSEIMLQDKETKTISLQHIEHCIGCGHCVDVCPTDSIVHSDFPPETVHPIDYSKMPTPEQIMLLLKSRRSNRTITPQPIPQAWLEQIIEAARSAPTASNSRKIDFTLITDPEKLKQIVDCTVTILDHVRKTLNNPVIKFLFKPFLSGAYRYLPVFERLKRNRMMGKDPILQNATALLIIHTPRNSRFGCEDANLAYQNASLMAQSLGVSQIYMGFILAATKQDKKGQLLQLFGIDEKPQAIMALGIPAFRYPKYTDKR